MALRAIGDGSAVDIERTLIDGGFGEHDSGVVLVPIGSTLDAAGITLHQHTMAGGRLDIDHHVSLFGERERPPCGVPDDHAAIASGRPGSGERAAMILGWALAIAIIGRREMQAFEPVGRDWHGFLELAKLDRGVDD